MNKKSRSEKKTHPIEKMDDNPNNITQERFKDKKETDSGLTTSQKSPKLNKSNSLQVDQKI